LMAEGVKSRFFAGESTASMMGWNDSGHDVT
jgi:hypothetical protein